MELAQLAPIIISALALAFIGYYLGRRDNSSLTLPPDKVSSYLFLSQTLKEEETGDIVISGELEDGSPIEFNVKMYTWTYLAEKTRIKGIHRKYNDFQVLCQVFEDRPIITHKHKNISEGIKMLKGAVELTISGRKIVLSAGDEYKIPANAFHSLRTLEGPNGEVYAEYIAYWP